MRQKQQMIYLMATGLVSLVAVTIAATTANKSLSSTACTIFAATFVVVALLQNRNIEQPESDNAGNLAAADLNAGLLALAFAWGGATILAGYYLTELFWHHAWQYGLGMLLIAALIGVYKNMLGQPESTLGSVSGLRWAAYLSLLLCAGALIGLYFLVSSGKLTAGKSDWLANHVFVAGAIAVAAVSLFAATAQLGRRNS